MPKDLNITNHGYSLVSNYYKMKCVRGVEYFKATPKSFEKVLEGRLNMDLHNFLVELTGTGVKLISNDKFENGEIR